MKVTGTIQRETAPCSLEVHFTDYGLKGTVCVCGCQGAVIQERLGCVYRVEIMSVCSALICVLLVSCRWGQWERDLRIAQQSAVLETRPSAPQTVSARAFILHSRQLLSTQKPTKLAKINCTQISFLLRTEMFNPLQSCSSSLINCLIIAEGTFFPGTCTLQSSCIKLMTAFPWVTCTPFFSCGFQCWNDKTELFCRNT